MRQQTSDGQLTVAQSGQQGFFIFIAQGLDGGLEFALFTQRGRVKLVAGQLALQQLATQGNAALALLGFDPLPNPRLGFGRFDRS